MQVVELLEMVMESEENLVEMAINSGKAEEIVSCLQAMRDADFNTLQELRHFEDQDTIALWEDQVELTDQNIEVIQKRIREE